MDREAATLPSVTTPITDPTAGRPTKPCQAPGCGAPITKPPKLSLVRWEQTKYCNRVCTGVALSAQLTKVYGESRPCGFAECPVIIVRRPGEKPAKWRTHLFCSISCASRSRRPPAKIDSKVCALAECDVVFHRTRRHSDKIWEKTRFCTAAHASASRKVARPAKRVRTPARASRPPQTATQDSAVQDPAVFVPIERTAWRPASWGGPVTVVEHVPLTG